MPFFYIKMNKDEFKNIIEPVVNRNKCILWGIEILRGKKRNTLRVYIDSNNTVDINDCENISKDLSYEPMLDISLGDDYILEVSSPGVDRKFFNIDQLDNFLGEELELRSKELIDGKRRFSGILSKCEEKYFYLKDLNNTNLIKFKFTELDMCKLKPNYNKLIKEHSYAK
jgi:ribosome maturation factor RimP